MLREFSALHVGLNFGFIEPVLFFYFGQLQISIGKNANTNKKKGYQNCDT